jgi:ribosomal protein S18 acetylase RimI-like enzyme
MKNSLEFQIKDFQEENQEDAKNLINLGLVEHWDTTDPTKNPDLNDIQTAYKDSVFLVAWFEGKIVGTGALIHSAGQTAEIVRMSVAPEVRRRGIGHLIIDSLVNRAIADGYQKIILETTEIWQDVIDFYLRYGFQITHYKNGDVYFELGLDT